MMRSDREGWGGRGVYWRNAAAIIGGMLGVLVFSIFDILPSIPPPSSPCVSSTSSLPSVAGGKDESVQQPQWCHRGHRLYFVSDMTDWWNMYAWDVHHHKVRVGGTCTTTRYAAGLLFSGGWYWR